MLRVRRRQALRETNEKPAEEIEVKFPASPQAENLIPFIVSATTDNQFMIDGESLNVSGNGVLRFTLVIVSPSGARNVSYEGMNCSTGERRLYAFGRPDGTWSKARNDQWTRIAREHAQSPPCGALYRVFLPRWGDASRCR
jgi:hypothetical protein